MSCQSTPASATEPQHLDNAAGDLGRPRVADVVDKPNGAQGINGSPLETRFSSCESFGSRTFSNTTNESRMSANDTANCRSASSQSTVIGPQPRRNATADLPYHSGFPTGSFWSKPSQGNAMFRWMSTIKSKANEPFGGQRRKRLINSFSA